MKTRTQKKSWGLIAFLGVATFIYTVVFYIVFPLVTGRPLGFQIHSELQRTFAEQHPIGLYIHIFPSMVAILLGPFQFLKSFRDRHLKLHRWLGRIYLGSVLVGGLAGLYMAQFSFAGTASRLGFGLLATAWLFTGYMAYLDIRQGRIDTHREWMMRNYALTLAAATLRIYTRSLISMGLTAPDFHYINAWACWVPNLIVAEWLIYRSRARRREAAQVLPAAGSQPG